MPNPKSHRALFTILTVASCFLILLFVCSGDLRAQDSGTKEIDFNRDIRPILAENCFYCHGQDPNQRQADLRLDHRDVAIDFGAIVPSDSASSELIKRVYSSDADLLMPPANSNRQLSDREKDLLQRWIDGGAVYEEHWAFIAPSRPKAPAVENQAWVRNPIDSFVLAKLEARGISPSREADRTTLIKRLYADLIGLPPKPSEVEQFVNDADPEAYEKLVDRLLANPHYGERLAIPWLDAARYADSNGFQQDGDTWQWMWRDWVVNAINEDLPFDQFTIWQLAGDLLPDATVDQKIASGFNRNHLLNGEGGAIAEEQRFNVLFDRVDTTSTNWLGLTIACAQCHDHKYDPVTQKEYYQLLDAFNRVPESGTPQFYSSRIRLGNPVLELPTEENKRRIAEFEKQIAEAEKDAKPIIEAAFEAWRVGIESDGIATDVKGLPKNLIEQLNVAADQRTEEQKSKISSELRKYFDKSIRPNLKQNPSDAKATSLKRELAAYRADQIPRPMIMSDAKKRTTHVLDRGEYLSKLEEVNFATPAFLPPMPSEAPQNRLGFAQWLVSSNHPLTARVQVNRMWQYFFGVGIVKTSEDFGVQSEYPVHKDLLDWLAVEFRESGWSRKKMHRLILTSSTYRQSSRMNEWHRNNDPENRLLARATRIRMPSMVLRDWALATSGLLNSKIGGAPVYPYQPDAVWEALAITKERDFTYPASKGDDLYRRSLYTFWRRTVGPTNMFDASNRQTCRVRASQTSTPLHALTTLNDQTWVEAGRVLAEQAMTESETVPEQIQFVFQRIVCRQLKDPELEWLTQSYEQQLAIYGSDLESANQLLAVGSYKRNETLDAGKHAALTVVCIGMLNLDEALTRE